MTEDEAKAWLTSELNVSRETFTRLAEFINLLKVAQAHQNLIAVSTFKVIWARHIVDSAQLLRHCPPDGTWLDIGTGAGFPGIVIALLTNRPVILVESRRLRATFLSDASAQLGLDKVTVCAARVETLSRPPCAVISARALSALGQIFAGACHLADANTVWVLPKGQSAASELAAARQTWQGKFAMQPSVTDPASAIITARRVAPRRPG